MKFMLRSLRLIVDPTGAKKRYLLSSDLRLSCTISKSDLAFSSFKVTSSHCSIMLFFDTPSLV